MTEIVIVAAPLVVVVAVLLLGLRLVMREVDAGYSTVDELTACRAVRPHGDARVIRGSWDGEGS